MRPLKIQVKMLLNRVQYDPQKDLDAMHPYFLARGVDLSFALVRTDFHGYSTRTVTNPMGGTQPVLQGLDPLVKPYLSPSDKICVTVIQGFKEFDRDCPSEFEEKQYVPGTRTILCCANADDPFYDQQPNFRIWLMHELMHALGTMARYDGFPVDDCMDVLVAPNGKALYYHLNYDPENPNSNFINMWERLYPWLKSKHVFD